MVTLGAVVVTCWLCALLATPRRPLRGNEIEELVYRRLLGRQQTVMLLAVLVTGVALLALAVTVRPNRVDADLQSVRPVCQRLVDGRAACNTLGENGRLTKIVFGPTRDG
jgi:hypothetical protein